MDYAVTCPCGTKTSVTATQAGLEVKCDCGEQVVVPPLSRLRRAAGREAYSGSGVVGKIRRMISSGELPWGNVCAYSGRPTEGSIDLLAECKKLHPIDRIWVLRFLRILLGLLANLVLILVEGLVLVLSGPLGSFWSGFDLIDVKRHGVEVVRVPLRVSTEWHDKLLGMRSQRRLREMLRTVPVYDELLGQFPDGKITVIGKAFI